MSPLDSRFGPPEPPTQGPPPGPGPPVWLHAIAAFLWGPLGLVVALALAVGVVAWVAGPPTLAAAGRTVLSAEAGGGADGRAERGSTTSLWVASQPSGATIEVRGDSVGVTPTWVRGIEPGPASVTARLGDLVLDSVVVLRSGGDRDLSFRFDPARLAASERASRPVAPPAVESERSASQTAERKSSPAPAASPPVAARPAPQPPRRPSAADTPREDPPAERRGTIEVEVPPGSAILIDGRVVMRDSGARYRTSLPTGSHQIRVVYPSTDDEQADVYVGGGVTTMVTFGPDPGSTGAWK